MNAADKLVESFSKFPGIGPRQSKRFVYFLLTRNQQFVEELATLLLELRKERAICSSCARFFVSPPSKSLLCEICRSERRTSDTLVVVEKDVDLENVERSGAFKGKYFVLGGTIPLLEKEPGNKIRLKQLLRTIGERSKEGLKEIILALSATPEGENTEFHLRQELDAITKRGDIKLSVLGRGLSTGAELEYLDPDTIKNAL